MRKNDNLDRDTIVDAYEEIHYKYSTKPKVILFAGVMLALALWGGLDTALEVIGVILAGAGEIALIGLVIVGFYKLQDKLADWSSKRCYERYERKHNKKNKV